MFTPSKFHDEALIFLLNGNQLHIKDERRVRPDDRGRSPRSVGKLRGDEELPPGADRHELQCLFPTGDDSCEFQCRGFPHLRAVEWGPIDEGAPVVDLHSVGFRRLPAVARLKNLVLQPARQGNDAFLRPVFS